MFDSSIGIQRDSGDLLLPKTVFWKEKNTLMKGIIL